MKGWLAAWFLATAGLVSGTTLSVVPVFEPISLRGTDVDGGFTDIGEALQATVVSRPMALSGAFPETLVEAIRTSHRLPSNDPEYAPREANLLVLCRVTLAAEMVGRELHVGLDVSRMEVPEGVDLTDRQVVKLAIVAIRKTLEIYQSPQPEMLPVVFRVVGAPPDKASLAELGCSFEIAGG
jgi:hypothetical protein